MDRGYLQTAINKIVLLCLLMFAPFLVFFVFKAFGLDTYFWQDVCFQSEGYGTPGCRPFYGMIWLAVISLACTFCVLGMITSMALRSTGSKFLFGSGYLEAIVLCTFGSIVAVFMISLFIGNFLSGSLFPSIVGGESFGEISMRVTDWGKLCVWAFIFGFSERLVPKLAESLSSNVSISQNSGQRS